MRDWKSFEEDGVNYRINMTEANDGMVVEVYSAHPFGNIEIKCYVQATLSEDGSMLEFHGDARADVPDPESKAGPSSKITEDDFSSMPCYSGLRAALDMGLEEARKRLREEAR